MLKGGITFFIIANCILLLSVGIIYMTPIGLCVNHYPHKKGFITGIVLCCIGFSGVAISQIFIAVVNPNNEKLVPDGTEKIYPKDVVDRMQRGMDILSIFIGVMGFLGSVLITPKKKMR